MLLYTLVSVLKVQGAKVTVFICWISTTTDRKPKSATSVCSVQAAIEMQGINNIMFVCD